MDMKLKVESGKHAGQEIRVTTRQFVIGRDDDCQLRATSEMISRRHCLLIVRDSYAGVRDLDSRNGTLVNGELVQNREVELRSGDKLCVGPLQFSVILNAGLTGKKLPAVHGVREAAARSIHSAPSTADDIAGWLMESAPAPPKAAADTQRVRLGETEVIDVAAAAGSDSAAANPHGGGAITTSMPAQTVSNASPAEGSGKNLGKPNPVSGPKKLPSKLPPSGAPAANTRQAAADMIDKMRRRR